MGYLFDEDIYIEILPILKLVRLLLEFNKYSVLIYKAIMYKIRLFICQ
jgi:hypothetical protein